ncbi:MAG: TAT-variant-translocated molybdopterin oxidoreductase [Planctomycetota bacterium]
MTQTQCPSTIGKVAVPEDAPGASRDAGGRKVWRSPEQLMGRAGFRDFVEREFPKGASELLKGSRRTFMKLMGASMALAGVATLPGCRRPDHKILTYGSEMPENIIVGKPLYFATSIPIPGGGAWGLLAETAEGRPTKLEGNPLHPASRGAADAQAIAQILNLYDPDRLTGPVFRRSDGSKVEATWDDFKLRWNDGFGPAEDGEGLVIIADQVDSPTRDAVKARVLAAYPRATWVTHNPLASKNARLGSEIAFGKPMREHLHFDKADVVVTLDRDPGTREPGSVRHSREIASLRKPMSSSDPMSRLYCAESGFSPFGSIADHRMPMSPQRVTAFAVELAHCITHLVDGVDSRLDAAIASVEVPRGPDFDLHEDEKSKTLAVARDLVAHRGRSLLIAGRTQPPEVHALTHAMNAVLDNVGKTVEYIEDNSETADSLAGVAEQIRAGRVSMMIAINCNPVYDTPGELGFAELWDKVTAEGITMSLDVGDTETAAASTWALNGTHALEQWGDTVAEDGTIAATQPMIAPLSEPAMSDIEFLSYIAGERNTNGYSLVRDVWQDKLGLSGKEFEKAWRRALHDGFVANTAAPTLTPDVDFAAVANAVGSLKLAEAPTLESMAVVVTDDDLGGGRYANNGWLQEAPHPMTKVVWDNPVVVSPNTADRLRLTPDDYTARQNPRSRLAKLNINGLEKTVPVWICPGMPDNVIQVTLGYGRTRAGMVGNAVGVDTYKIRPHDGGLGAWTAEGCTLTRTSGTYPISSTQNHWSLEGRTSVARSLDVQVYREHVKKAEDAGLGFVADPFVIGAAAKKGTLHVGEKLGELSHTPPSISAYKHPFEGSRVDGEVDEDDDRKKWEGHEPAFTQRPQWGMTIDMAACNGCNACLVACQSENNIPVVGKAEVAKGREMHWIRVDRYFVGDDLNAPEQVMNQAIACVHCEFAPCEVVCPVNATVHDEEGLNVMAYNRCIGTRYCMNNCPYKVRRFNFFDYAQSKFNGGLDENYVGETVAARGTAAITADPEAPAQKRSRINQNFIPPRLRAKLDEVSKFHMNPDVTVRGRGVMEKCTYCIQRINQARYESKIQGLDHIPDGFFQVACQSACPSEAIRFGDILDERSKVSEARHNQRGYLLLQYLNTRPRTSHLIHLTNPNPEIREPVTPEALLKGHGKDYGGGEYGDKQEKDQDQASGSDHAFFRDPSNGEPGYAVSLNVLGQSSANSSSLVQTVGMSRTGGLV